jgi:predicted transposase YdaD
MAVATPESTIAAAERLAGLRLPRGALLAALKESPMIDELLRESSIIQAFIEEGEAQGEARGKAEGEAAGERKMAQIAVEGRFGPLGEEAVAALGRVDEATLREVVAQSAMLTLEQVRARLGLS